MNLLLQGTEFPLVNFCSETPLPLAKERLTHSTPPVIPATFEEPIDTTGQASVRRRLEFTQPPPTPSQEEKVVVYEVIEAVDQTLCPKKISRTTEWRKRSKELNGEETKLKKPRKEYSCSKCNKPMSSDGHSQFKGKRFCAVSDGKTKEEWLKEMRTPSI